MKHRRPHTFALKALRLIGVNVLVLAAALGAIEGGVRLAYPEIAPYRTEAHLFEPGVYGATRGIARSASGYSGSALLRSDETRMWRYSAAAESQQTWLFLGDSVTMGVYVASDSTFAGRLHGRVGVRNPSIVGYTPADYARVASAVAERERPQRVLVNWCPNDIYLDAVPDSAPEVDPGPIGHVHRFLLSRVYTYQVVKALLFDRTAQYYAYEKRLYADSARVAGVRDQLSRIAGEARGVGAELTFVVHPYLASLGDPDWPGLMGPITERALALGFDVVDATPWLERQSDHAALYLYGDGFHYSERGHAVVAAGLIERYEL